MKKFFIVILVLLLAGIGIYVLGSMRERQVYLSDVEVSYKEVGYYDLYANEDYNKEPLSLLVEGNEQEFEKGFFAHAHSTIVFDGLKDYNPKMFSVYIGANKTARNNGNTKVKFMIYFDQELVFESEEVTGNTEAKLVELEMKKVNRITLVIDDLGGNGNDHGVWASPLLTYRGWSVLE